MQGRERKRVECSEVKNIGSTMREGVRASVEEAYSYANIELGEVTS